MVVVKIEDSSHEALAPFWHWLLRVLRLFVSYFRSSTFDGYVWRTSQSFCVPSSFLRRFVHVALFSLCVSSYLIVLIGIFFHYRVFLFILLSILWTIYSFFFIMYVDFRFLILFSLAGFYYYLILQFFRSRAQHGRYFSSWNLLNWISTNKMIIR